MTMSAKLTSALFHQPGGLAASIEVEVQHINVILCQIMAERHPDDFVARALTVRGPRRKHIAAALDGMINPVPIGVAGLWLEANQSATSAQRVAQLILKAFGYADNDLHIVIQL